MMVAYSFNRRFAEPILKGTKCQTVRADRRRHARPGEALQLYCGMRTRNCSLIARTICVDVQPILIEFERSRRRHTRVYIAGVLRFAERRELDAFARDDGFPDWSALRLFWHDNHPDVTDFRGVIIRWRGADANEPRPRVETAPSPESNRKNRKSSAL